MGIQIAILTIMMLPQPERESNDKRRLEEKRRREEIGNEVKRRGEEKRREEKRREDGYKSCSLVFGSNITHSIQCTHGTIYI